MGYLQKIEKKHSIENLFIGGISLMTAVQQHAPWRAQNKIDIRDPINGMLHFESSQNDAKNITRKKKVIYRT